VTAKSKKFSDLGGRWNKIEIFSIDSGTLEEQQVINRENFFLFDMGLRLW
jgi:hypothetical protein